MPVVLALVLAAAGSVQAQNQPQARPSGPPPSGIGEVLGTIVDTADKAPVPRASITIRTKADSALVTGAYSAQDGTFRVQGLRPGAYYMRAVSIGFTAAPACVTTKSQSSPISMALL